MNGETRLGLGLAGVVVLCCAGPLVLSLLASGAAIGAFGAVWADGRPLLLGSGTVLVVLGAWLLTRRRPGVRATPRLRDTPGPPRDSR